MTLGVLLVDDHPAVIDSIGRALNAMQGVAVRGSARSVVGAFEAIESLGPELDVVVCDVQLGGDAEGLRILERFSRVGRPRFLMLSAFDYPTLIRASAERGAAGYVIKTADLGDIVTAVLAVGRGETSFSTSALRSMANAPRRPSERELDVLKLVVAGAGNEEIARRLVLSLKTIESHLRRLFNRYGLMNRTELAVLALREGWVEPEPSSKP